jgi:hypothetical protein
VDIRLVGGARRLKLGDDPREQLGPIERAQTNDGARQLQQRYQLRAQPVGIAGSQQRRDTLDYDCRFVTVGHGGL